MTLQSEAKQSTTDEEPPLNQDENSVQWCENQIGRFQRNLL